MMHDKNNSPCEEIIPPYLEFIVEESDAIYRSTQLSEHWRELLDEISKNEDPDHLSWWKKLVALEKGKKTVVEVAPAQLKEHLEELHRAYPDRFSRSENETQSIRTEYEILNKIAKNFSWTIKVMLCADYSDLLKEKYPTIFCVEAAPADSEVGLITSHIVTKEEFEQEREKSAYNDLIRGSVVACAFFVSVTAGISLGVSAGKHIDPIVATVIVLTLGAFICLRYGGQYVIEQMVLLVVSSLAGGVLGAVGSPWFLAIPGAVCGWYLGLAVLKTFDD